MREYVNYNSDIYFIFYFKNTNSFVINPVTFVPIKFMPVTANYNCMCAYTVSNNFMNFYRYPKFEKYWK